MGDVVTTTLGAALGPRGPVELLLAAGQWPPKEERDLMTEGSAGQLTSPGAWR